MPSFGHYELTAVLGRGGMGEVHRAVDTAHHGRIVALKVLAPHLSTDDAYRARFRRECEIAAQLREPHIVPIHRYGEIDDRLFLEMQLVDGPDLGALLAGHGPLPPARAVAIIEQVAAALDAAHGAGLVHRDVKPSNVLLAAPVPDRPDFAMLTDFGIAAGADGSAGGAHVGGTVEYMAPERLGKRPADHRVDIYALVCVLYELLTATRTFPGAEFAAQVHGHLHLPPPRPSAVSPQLPAGLDAVVAQGLAKDPAHRHQSAGALAAHARAALRPAPTVLDLPASPARPVSRRGLLLGAVGAVLLAGGGVATAAVLTARSEAASRPLAAAAPSARPTRQAVLTERALEIRSTQMFPFLTGKSGETPVAAIVGLDRHIHVRDLVTDTDVGMPIPTTVLTYLGLADVDGRTVVARCTYNGTIETTDLRTGQPVGTPIEAHPGAYVEGIVTGTLDGRAVAATVAKDLTLRRWDLATRTQIGTPIALPAEGSRAGLGLLTIGGKLTTHIHVGSTVFLHEFVSGAPVPHANTDHTIIEIDGVAVVAEPYGHDVRVRDLATGSERRIIKGGDGGVARIALATVERRAVVAMSWANNTIAVRDLATGAAVGEPLSGHQAPVTVLGVTDLHGTPILVSAARDNSIRVWDLAARAAA